MAENDEYINIELVVTTGERTIKSQDLRIPKHVAARQLIHQIVEDLGLKQPNLTVDSIRVADKEMSLVDSVLLNTQPVADGDVMILKVADRKTVND